MHPMSAVRGRTVGSLFASGLLFEWRTFAEARRSAATHGVRRF